MVDELIAERGVRAPFIRLAKEGDVLAKDCYLGPAGFGAEMPDQVDSAKVLAQFASGATIVLQGLHRLWPPLIDFVRGLSTIWAIPCRRTPTSPRPTNRGFDPHYDVHDVFVLQAPDRSAGSCTSPFTTIRCPRSRGPHRAAIAERVTGDPGHRHRAGGGDALYLPRGWVHSAQCALETTSIHLTIGVSAPTGLDVARAVVDQLWPPSMTSENRCRWAAIQPIRMRRSRP